MSADDRAVTMSQRGQENTIGSWQQLQEHIKTRYPAMSTRLQQVAAYILENPRMVAFETIAVIAEQMDVPPSTLIRFASALGFSGFNDLKQIVKDDLLEQTSNYSNRIQLMRADERWRSDELLSRFAEANRDALRHFEETVSETDLSQAVKMLNGARHIFLLGNGRAHTVVTYLHYALSHAGKKVFLISGTGGMVCEQMSNVEAGDLLLAVAYSPYTSVTCEQAAKAIDKGAYVLSITDSSVSPLVNTAELCFVVQEARVDSFRSMSASLLLAQVLAIATADRI
jgi:DNA-binding MurR/RpiR family transcriptional regulator